VYYVSVQGCEGCIQVSETFELQFRCRIIDLTPQARCDNLVQIAFLMRLINGCALIAFAVMHETGWAHESETEGN